jgi:hypothetical protein
MAKIQLVPPACHVRKVQREGEAGFWRLTTLTNAVTAEPEDELGAAEPSMGDSLLNAFKLADFDPIDDDEKPEEEIEDSNKPGASGEE